MSENTAQMSLPSNRKLLDYEGLLHFFLEAFIKLH